MTSEMHDVLDISLVVVLPLLVIAYFYVRFMLITKLKHESNDLIKSLDNPKLFARIGNEPFLNFVLRGHYKNFEFSRYSLRLFLFLRMIVIAVIVLLLIYPVFAILNLALTIIGR